MQSQPNISSTSALLRAGEFIDSSHLRVIEFTEQHSNPSDTNLQKSIDLYLAVRDQIAYDPYSIRLDREEFQASTILKLGRGFCVSKAVLYAAVLRAAGVPARLGFADVRNHLTTPRLEAMMGTDTFYYHGYTELLLEKKWVKATPAFNIELCNKFGIKPLEFNGLEDSIFHPYDTSGRHHMEYIQDHGSRDDLPYDELIDVYEIHYPFMFETQESTVKGDFHAEAEQTRNS